MSNPDKTVFVFPILWEYHCKDVVGYIKERDDGKRYLEMTMDGVPYEEDVGELLMRMQTYKAAIELTQKAIDLL
jgi:hypothetical protein